VTSNHCLSCLSCFSFLSDALNTIFEVLPEDKEGWYKVAMRFNAWAYQNKYGKLDASQLWDLYVFFSLPSEM